MSDRHEPGRTPEPAPSQAAAHPNPPPLTHEQLERWAGLVAAGEADFPDGLSPAQQHQLRARVRRLRRARLVAFIARQVALDLHRQRQQQLRPAPRPAKRGTTGHAQAKD